MSNHFQTEYLAFLRKQVGDEIHYLITYGHDKDRIEIPCMFCVQHQNGNYHCRRLFDLRQFQSQIIGNQAEHSRQARFKEYDIIKGNNERRKIGLPIDESFHPDDLTANSAPLLNLKF